MNFVGLRRAVWLFIPLTLAAALLLLGGIIAAQADTLTVTNNSDSGTGSLRQVIAAAESNDVISFDQSLSGQTILLTSGQLELTKSLKLDGSNLSDKVRISGGGASRVLNIHEHVTVSLSHLAIISGSIKGNLAGGAISNHGTLFLNQSAVYGSSATTIGGGIFNASGQSMVIRDSVVHHNSALSGGGIANNGRLTVERSTLHNNMAVTGGAIASYGQALTVTNSTVAGNSAGAGGGLWTTAGFISLSYNTFYENSALVGGAAKFLGGSLDISSTIMANSPKGGDCFAAEAALFTNNSHNLIMDGSCAEGAVNQVAGDPLLGVLADNGGPTPTIEPFIGSPAVDAGDRVSCPEIDQRGVKRPLNGDDRGEAECDIGSVEAALRPYYFYFPFNIKR